MGVGLATSPCLAVERLEVLSTPRTRGADQRRREEGGGGGVTPLRLRRQGSQHRRDQTQACTDKGKIKAEKYGDPQLIAEIKTALERKLREMLGDEYEQWKEYIKVKEGGRRLVITQQLLQRLTQSPNTAKQNEKT
jgi:hypothetical protein